MKIKKLVSIFLFSLAMICAGNLTHVLAEDATEEDLKKAADAYNKKQTYDGYKVVCKKEAPIGSHIKKKVCRTVATIDRQHRDAKRVMDKSRISLGEPQ